MKAERARMLAEHGSTRLSRAIGVVAYAKATGQLEKLEEILDDEEGV